MITLSLPIGDSLYSYFGGSINRIQCPICLAFVSDLKPKCHVIPKWLTKLAKDNKGRYFEISPKKNGSSGQDIKTKSWCDSCEKEFAVLDGIGAAFFRDHPWLSEKITGEVNKFLFHDQDRYLAVKKFVGSIVVRHYLRALANKLPILQSENILNDFFKTYLENKDFHIVLHDLRKFFLGLSGLPMISQGTIQVMINGFLVAITTEDLDMLITGKELIIFNITNEKHPYVRSFFDFLYLRSKSILE